MALASTLPLTTLNAAVMVQAALNGKPARLVFDTGAYTSILTLAASDRLGLHLLTGEEFDSVRGIVSGIGGGRAAIAVVAHTVELGGLHAKDFNFMAADVVRPPADGLLSADLISQFDIDLDFPEHQIRLFRPLGDCSAPAAFLASPLYQVGLLPIGEDRRPRVRVTIAGQSLVALIDTGAAHTAIFRHAAEKLGLRYNELAEGKRTTVQGVGPNTIRGVVHMLEPVAIGDLEVDHLPVDVLDARGDDEVEMLLGADFQRAVHVWISYSSHTLIMQYPPLASKHVDAVR